MSVEVKIQCDCGTRYKFDVVPWHGRMPQRVNCPGCGVDGTMAANAFLHDRLRGGSGTAARVSPTFRGGFALGVAGAVAAGVVAMLAWFFLIKVTGHQLGFAAWGVGLLTGLGARALGRAGGRRLGLAAGGCAGAAILAGQWLATHDRVSGFGWLTLLWLLMAVWSAFHLGASRAGAR